MRIWAKRKAAVYTVVFFVSRAPMRAPQALLSEVMELLSTGLGA